MSKRIVYENQDGSVSVIIPADCGLSIDEIAAKDVPHGVAFHIVDVADVPSDRAFRGAWNIGGGSVGIDMVKARVIHRDNLRKLRKPLLDAADIEYLKAVEVGDSVAVAAVVARKQALRDVTKHVSIEAAQTPDELKLAVLDVLR